MKWTYWDIRLAKIIRSMWLFSCKKEMEAFQALARTVKPGGGLRYGRICLDEVLYMALPEVASGQKEASRLSQREEVDAVRSCLREQSQRRRQHQPGQIDS